MLERYVNMFSISIAFIIYFNLNRNVHINCLLRAETDNNKMFQTKIYTCIGALTI